MTKLIPILFSAPETAVPASTLSPKAAAFDFNASLGVMLRGMLSIFFVTAVLIALVLLLNRYSKKKKRAEDK